MARPGKSAEWAGAERAPTVTIPALLPDGNDGEFRELVALLYAASGRLQSMRRELAQTLSLGMAEFAVLTALMHLQDKGSVRVRTIADHLHVAAAQITAVIRQLEAGGWVDKTVDPTDNRAVSLNLSDTARERLADFAPLLCAVNDRWFAGMSRQELRSVSRFLQRLVDQFDSASLKAKDLRNELA